MCKSENIHKNSVNHTLNFFCLPPQSQEPSILTSDLKYLQDDLQLKKANVFRSIPYSRFGSNRDAHCYRKAYPHLLAFRVGTRN